MSNAPATKTIAAATVPGTQVEITIVRRWVRKSELHKSFTATYVVERRPNAAPFVNYLSCGRDSLTEARAEANFLFTDTVNRRDRFAADQPA